MTEKCIHEEYFNQCVDHCDVLDPEMCRMFVRENITAQRNRLSELLAENKMIGLTYWTQLIDGGYVWLEHPINCSEAQLFCRDGVDYVKAFSHIYNKNMEFDVELIQVITSGNSYIERTQKTIEMLSSVKVQAVDEQDDCWNKEQFREYVFSTRIQQDSLPVELTIQLIGEFEKMFIPEDVLSQYSILTAEEHQTYKNIWKDIMISSKETAIRRLNEELENTDLTEDDVEEIELLKQLLDEHVAESFLKIDQCENTIQAMEIWPAILLPNPLANVVQYYMTDA